MIKKEQTKYYAMTAKESVERYRRVVLWKSVGLIAAYLAVMVLFFRYLNILTILLLSFLTVQIGRLTSRAAFREFNGILETDCDPVKLDEAAELLNRRMKKPRAKARLWLVRAKCRYYMGDYAEMKRCLDNVVIGKRMESSHALKLNLQGLYAVKTGNWTELARCRAEQKQLAAQGARNRALPLLMQLPELWDCGEALARGDGDKARALQMKFLERATKMFQKVAGKFALAELDLKEGKEEMATLQLQFCAAHGGTMVMKRRADEMLARLNGRAPERDFEEAEEAADEAVAIGEDASAPAGEK